MQVVETISEIKATVSKLFVQDDKEVLQTILKSSHVVFLDTCFVSRVANDESTEKIVAFFKKIEAVFVVTDLLLYEMKDSKDNCLQVHLLEFQS